jgi:hypothetical protein
MAEVVVSAVFATTHRVAKYGGFQLRREQLEVLQGRINAGQVPMVNNHSALQTLDATYIGSDVVETEDGEYALQVNFAIEEAAWKSIESEWHAAGVSGGFSVTVSGVQEKLSGPSEQPMILSADAAAYSDEARAKAGRLLSQAGAVEVRRLYQFGSVELARIALELLPSFLIGISSGLITHLIIDAVGGLVAEAPEPSVIEVRLQNHDSSYKTAVIITDDPEVVRAAIESLDTAASGDARVQEFDSEKRLWLPPSH